MAVSLWKLQLLSRKERSFRRLRFTVGHAQLRVSSDAWLGNGDASRSCASIAAVSPSTSLTEPPPSPPPSPPYVFSFFSFQSRRCDTAFVSLGDIVQRHSSESTLDSLYSPCWSASGISNCPLLKPRSGKVLAGRQSGILVLIQGGNRFGGVGIGESEVARAYTFQSVQFIHASPLCNISRSTFTKPCLGANRETLQVLKEQGPFFCKKASAFSGHRCCASASSGIVEQSSSQSNSQMASSTPQSHQDGESISYLSQAEAAAIDEMLMGELGFSIDQLMELAGLSVASAVAEVYGVKEYSRVLVICGPGNNGGDGLVAARHLHHFGYKPSICYPKPTNKPLYHGLVTQLESLRVPFVSAEELPSKLKDEFELVIDAMFGFSFHGIPRPPFDSLLRKLVIPHGTTAEEVGAPPAVSVDIPSGWHVENGDTEGTGLRPDMLVSLTAPKLCAKLFNGAHHYLGGRFVPPAVVEKFSLRLPPYPGHSMCVLIGGTNSKSVDVAALRLNYVGFELLEEQAKKDPLEQFKVWFDDAVSHNVAEPNAMTLATVSKDGQPSARLVLLKGYDERGFVWYTNYGSRKAAELKANPKACLVFFWEPLHRSVRIEGSIEIVSSEESDTYFHSRPRGSQIGALVSAQSTVISGRPVLDKANDDLNAEYADGKFIPRPAHWGGFRLIPEVIEFWQGRESRLHDRLRYKRASESTADQAWTIERLSP